MSVIDLYTDRYVIEINGELYQATSAECVSRIPGRTWNSCDVCCRKVSSQTKCPLSCPVCGTEIPQRARLGSGQSYYRCECGLILLTCHDDSSNNCRKYIVTGYMNKLLDSKEDVI